MLNQRFKRLILTSAKWLLSGAMLAYVLHEIDFAVLKEMLTQQKPIIVLGAFALIILQLQLASFRWQRITRNLVGQGATPPYHSFLRLNFIGMFFNCCLPGTIGGDAVRGMMLRAEDRSISLCLHSVIIDRIAALVAVFVMVVIGLPWLAKLVPNVPVVELITLFCALVIVGGIALFYAPRWTCHKLVGKVARLLASARSVVFSPFDMPIIMLQAMTAHGLFCLAVTMLVASFGTTFHFTDSLLLVPLVLLLTTLPISVGGWGVRELGMVGLLAFAGVPKPLALAVSVQLGIIQMLVSVPGAWFYLKRKQAG